MRGGHCLRVEGLVQFLLGHQAVLKHEVIDAAAGLEGFLRDLGGGLVADLRVQGRDNADGVLHHLVAVVHIDGDAVDALGAEGVHHINEPGLALEDALDDDGLHHVQLQLAGLGGEGDGSVVADDLEAHLVRDLGDDGVHLARHDGGTRRHRRQIDLVQAAARAGGHEAQVVADLGKFHGQTLQRGGIAHVCACVRGRFHEVRSFLELVARELGETDGAQFRKARNGVEAGSDGGPAHIDFRQEDGVALEVCNLFLKVVGEGVEFLAGGHGDCVLELGAPHLDYVLELLALGAEGVDELLERSLELPVHPYEGVAEGGRVGIVRRLGAVDMVIGGAELVLALFVSHQFEGAVCDNLVGVHVDGSTGAALHHIYRELVVELAGYYFLAGSDYCVCYLTVEDPKAGIGFRSRHLYVSDGDYILGVIEHVCSRDLVIL